MATILYSALSSINNNLCADGAKGYVSLTYTPLFFMLNPIFLILVLVTSVFIRYTGSDNWQNSSNGVRSFKRTLGFTVLEFYLAILVILLLYKIFFCNRTKGYTKLYSQIGGSGGKVNQAALVNLASQYL